MQQAAVDSIGMGRESSQPASALKSELERVQEADQEVATSENRTGSVPAAKRIERVTTNQAAAMAELKSSLHRERDSNSGRQTSETIEAEQSVSHEARESETARLIARAKALLGRGNIGAARVVLQRAAKMGSAQATFALAETYDPNVLATSKTPGIRGDATKARNLYARAYDRGVKIAGDRARAVKKDTGQAAGWFGREAN